MEQAFDTESYVSVDAAWHQALSFDWLFRKQHTTEHRKLLNVIHEVLNDDEHFGEMTWYEEQEYNSSKDAVGYDGLE